MTLQEALKVNGKATSIDENGYVLLLDGRLYRQHKDGVGHPEECSFERSIKDIWLPYKEPCAHEPEDLSLGGHWEHKQAASQSWCFGGQFVREKLIRPKCKHCGAKIKAKEWIEV